jgi:hypothetical protein
MILNVQALIAVVPTKGTPTIKKRFQSRPKVHSGLQRSHAPVVGKEAAECSRQIERH